VNLSASWMVGDIEADIAAGHRAGTRAVLVGLEKSTMSPDFRAEDFAGAVRHILQRSGGNAKSNAASTS
jgi:phosphoglycolate phosphatase-like HAD superfamily hydrolase